VELKSPPKLTVSKGKVPNAPDEDTRRAVFFTVEYSYQCKDTEIDFIERENLIILEEVTIKGFNPASPGNDIDLTFGIRPQFTVRPPDRSDAASLRLNSEVTRKQKLFVLKEELSKALNVNGLMLDSVIVNVRLTYAHIGESDSVPVNLD
jgi:hypothetical protein